jgi:hypothetical protein
MLVGLFLVVYLPFAVASRPIWTNSALSALPFAVALVALAASRLARRWPRAVATWGTAVLAIAALLWFPAAGLHTAPGDLLVNALVPPEAYLRLTPHGPSSPQP